MKGIIPQGRKTKIENYHSYSVPINVSFGTLGYGQCVDNRVLGLLLPRDLANRVVGASYHDNRFTINGSEYNIVVQNSKGRFDPDQSRNKGIGREAASDRKFEERNKHFGGWIYVETTQLGDTMVATIYVTDEPPKYRTFGIKRVQAMTFQDELELA